MARRLSKETEKKIREAYRLLGQLGRLPRHKPSLDSFVVRMFSHDGVTTLINCNEDQARETMRVMFGLAEFDDAKLSKHQSQLAKRLRSLLTS